MSSASEYTAYHMKCINFFKWTCLSRSYIKELSPGFYKVFPSPIVCRLMHFIYFANLLFKQIFLLLLITGHLGPTEFLDTICGLDYFLCGVMVFISYIIWQRYPLYEIIYRLWEVENRIYRKLGRPSEIKWEAEERHGITLWAHTILTGVGCCSLLLQFNEAPKYCVFTYSLIEADNMFLRSLFCVHEMLFLQHAWFAMSCGNGLCTFEAVNISLIIKKMAQVLKQLSEDTLTSHEEPVSVDYTIRDIRSSEIYKYNDRSRYTEIEDPDPIMMRRSVTRRNQRNARIMSNTQNSAGNSRYGFYEVVRDYQQLMFISEQFNAWMGYKIVALSICGFCQYISSTTMAFQVLKIPGTGIGDIWFYIQDCTVAIYVTFRVFNTMSIVLPASQNLLQSVKNYMAAKKVAKGYARKFQRTLRPVSLKVGSCPLRRETVLSTMAQLANYYLCVALW